MRNAFVALVSLCIGVVSGFIVPSSDPEYTSQTSTYTEKSTDLETSTTLQTSKFSVLPKNRSDIDEKDLYEHATVKQNNQSERAFIYINQKYKKPVRNKIFLMPAVDKPEIVRNYVTKPKPMLTTIVPKPRPTFFETGHGNSYFQAYELSDKGKQDVQSYFAGPLPLVPGCEQKTQFKETEKVRTLVQMTHRADERRDYFELLKPPLLRPVNRVNNKPNYDESPEKEFAILATSTKPYKEFYKKPLLNSQYLSKSKKVEERPNENLKNYGFERTYMQYPIFRKKEEFQRIDDVNLDDTGFVGEDDSHRLYESNQEDDKLLAKYLKETLEEQVVSNDVANNNQGDCSYRDCILKSSKQYSPNSLLLKPECKCGRRLNIKLSDPFIAKDRSLREEGHRNGTVHKSSEVNYYEQLLNDDSNNNKLDDDFIRPPSRYNKTSNH